MENISSLAYSAPPRASNSNTPERDALTRFGCATTYTTIQTRTMKPSPSSLHHSLSGLGLPSSGLVSRGPADVADCLCFLCFFCFFGFLTSAPSTGCLPAAVGFGATASFGAANSFGVAGLGAATGFGAAADFGAGAGFGTGSAGVRAAVAGFGGGDRGLVGFGLIDWGAGATLGATGLSAAGLGFEALVSGFGETGASPFGPGVPCFVAVSLGRCCGLAGLRAAGFRFAGARGSGAPGFRLAPPNTRPSPAMRAEEQERSSSRRGARGRRRGVIGEYLVNIG